MNTDILDLNINEIEMISGASEIEPPVNVTTGDDYPIVDNNPP